jgi:DNA primase
VARYTDDSKERVRDAVDMVDLVGTRVKLRRAGATRYEGLCPLNDERTPSFGINPADKLFHCFGCGEGGDAFKFVQLTEGVDFKGALEFLADRYGVQLEVVEEHPAAAERRRARDRLLELLERTAAWYVRALGEA